MLKVKNLVKNTPSMLKVLSSFTHTKSFSRNLYIYIYIVYVYMYVCIIRIRVNQGEFITDL